MTDRRARILARLDTAHGHGMEIGPLYTPIATKDTCDVTYVDIHFAPGLKDYYRLHPGIPVDDIVDVDFALIQDGRTASISEATAAAAPFDWVVASHVIEHVPDVIGWLKDVAAVLVDGGRLALAVPDRRYCFDARRPETTVGEMLLAHANQDTRPSVRAVFDHYSSAVSVTPVEAWTDGPPGPDAAIHDLDFARAMLHRSVEEGEYVDSHVWLFTPRSLIQQLSVLAELGHLDFTVDAVIATDVNDMEFFVTLQRVPRAADETARRALFAGGFPPPIENDRPEPSEQNHNGAGSPAGPDHVDPTRLAITEREEKLIAAKRAVIVGGRKLVSRLTHR